MEKASPLITASLSASGSANKWLAALAEYPLRWVRPSRWRLATLTYTPRADTGGEPRFAKTLSRMGA